MQNKKSFFALRRNSILHRTGIFSSFSLLLLFTFMLFPITHSNDQAEATISEDYGLEVIASKRIESSLKPTSEETLSVIKDTISVTSGSRIGYKFYIASETPDMLLENDETSESRIYSTESNFDAPAPLLVSEEKSAKWGFAIAGYTGFDKNYTTTNSNLKFAAVPTTENLQLIHSASGQVANDNIDIYYGIIANDKTISGTYTTTIYYYVVTDMTNQEEPEIIIENSQYTEGYENAIISAQTSFYADLDITEAAVKIGDLDCLDINITQQKPTSITCSLPKGIQAGEYDLSITFKTIADGVTWAATKENAIRIKIQPRPIAIQTNDNHLDILFNDTEYRIDDNFTYVLNNNEITSQISAIYTFSDKTSSPWAHNTDIETVSIEESFKQFKPTSLNSWFHENKNVSLITGLENIDTSNVTTMANTFSQTGYDSPSLTLSGLDNWDTSNVTSMSSLFFETGRNSTSWDIGDLSAWNVGNVTNFYGMFFDSGKNALEWNVGNLDNWDTKNATIMFLMYYGAGSESQTWNTGHLDNWNTSKVTDMTSMFRLAARHASSFDIGDIGKWDIGNVTSINAMFYGSGTYAGVWQIGDLSNWNVSNITSMNSVFAMSGNNVSTWNIGDLSKWDMSNITDLGAMFYMSGTHANTFNIGDIGKWNVSNVKSLAATFMYSGRTATEWYIGDLSSWDVSNVVQMENAFYEAGEFSQNWDIGNLDNWNTSKVTDMSGMFRSAGGFSTLSWNIGDISGWDTSNVTSMNDMFKEAGHFINHSQDLSGWNVDNVTKHVDFNASTESQIIPPIWKQ